MLAPSNTNASYQSRQQLTAHFKLWLSRLLRSFPFLLLHRIPLPIFLLLGIECVWICFDRYVTSQQYFKPPRRYIRPTESSPLSPYYDSQHYDPYHGPIRAFAPHEFPCSSLVAEPQYLGAASSSSPGVSTGPTDTAPLPIPQSGFYLLMQPRVASGTLASITARIARQVAQRTYPPTQLTTNQTSCASTMARVNAKRFKQRNLETSFLWTMVREPVDRMVSHFSHVAVSRWGKEPTLENFQTYLKETVRSEYGSYFRTMSTRRYLNPHRQDMWETYVEEILSFYNFVGVLERWDESLAVLQLLMGLETQDLLHFKVRSSSLPGGISYLFDETTTTSSSSSSLLTEDKKQCIPLKPVPITLPWKEYLHQPFLFEEVFEADVYLYEAMNASLDATIASLGPEKVDQAVQRLQWAQQQVEQASCAEEAIFPCSSEGRPQSTVDCLVADVGCGSTCIDAVGKSLSTDPNFAQIN